MNVTRPNQRERCSKKKRERSFYYVTSILAWKPVQVQKCNMHKYDVGCESGLFTEVQHTACIFYTCIYSVFQGGKRRAFNLNSSNLSWAGTQSEAHHGGYRIRTVHSAWGQGRKYCSNLPEFTLFQVSRLTCQVSQTLFHDVMFECIHTLARLTQRNAHTASWQ